MPLENISSKDIDQFISSATAKSKHSASLYYRTIKAAFNKALVWNYISENPFNKIKPPKVPKPFPAFINANELQQILDNTVREFLKPIFYTAFYTSMRLAEILNMKWNWIDFQNNIITVKCDGSFTFWIHF
jgi:integrase